MSSPPPGWPDPHSDAGVDDTLALLPPDALWPPLPPPDLSQPPPWLLPPPAPGAPPPPPPPGGWASSWETAVEWPPPPAPPWAHQDVPQAYAHAAFWPPPGGHAAATHEEDEDAGAYDEYEDDEPYEEPYDEGAFAAAGEVVWRVGDALDDDEEEDETPEVALELTDEWAARFALTEHRRAQRKLQERAANRQGGQAPDAPPSDATPAAAAPAGPPLTVVDIVRAAGTATSRPNEALYGAAGAVRVAALEAAVQARYTKAQSGGKALLWPCEPLRSA